MTQEELSLMAVMNTDARINRIKLVSVWLDHASLGGVAEPIVDMSHPIVMSLDDVEIFYDYFVEMVMASMSQNHFDVEFIEKKLTGFVSSMLLYCKAFFEDEVEGYEDKGMYNPFDETVHEREKFMLD